MSTRAARLALAGATGAVVSVALYAILRFAQLLAGPEPNPATVIWSAHSGFLWRSGTTLYAGGMASCAGYLAAVRAPALLARALVPLLTVAAALLVLQALVAP